MLKANKADGVLKGWTDATQHKHWRGQEFLKILSVGIFGLTFPVN